MDKKLTTPILFLVFDRPDKTQKVFDVIRKAQPKKLYVAADAPRDGNENDTIQCQKVREIVKQVDWNCETHYLFHEKNLGCSLAGKSAWDWFFSHEKEMIFIEDDGLVTNSFFYYCQELLRKYRNDEHIAYIGGVNFGLKYGTASYFFTRCSVSTYAMATWKRVYDLYDYDLESYPAIRNTKDFQGQFVNRFERDRELTNYDDYVKSVKSGHRRNTYDLQMWYLVRKYNKWCIYPNLNQATNIGFDLDGSNTAVDPNSDYAKSHTRPRYELTEIIHPDKVGIDMKFEKKMFKQRKLYDQSVLKAMFWFYVLSFYRNFIKRKL
ncbi:MAG: hypothetical protein PHE51_07450 [Eubacteriales bacterium]|nr:hypothetical protein [Eubacteriales bacterium]